MGTGAITQYVDVAQLVLYLFWAFFAGLIYYLTVESKREGFPLETDRADGSIRFDNGIAGMPTPKVYKTEFHGDFVAPHGRDRQELPVQGRSLSGLPSMPLEPTGNPMTSGIGPGAFTQRSNKPDMTAEVMPASSLCARLLVFHWQSRTWIQGACPCWARMVRRVVV